MKLTDTKIKATRPTNKDQWLNDGAGLYLRIYPTGTRAWVVRKKRHKKTHIIRLGEYPHTSLKQARLEAARYQLQGTVSSTTVADLVDQYSTAVVSKHKRPELFEGYMRRAVLPALGNRMVRDVTTVELSSMIEDYARTRGAWQGARTADQLRSVTGKLFKYAVAKGYRPDNPMVSIDATVSGYKAIARDRVLSDEEIRLLWAEKKPNARVLRFQLLTGLRIGEAQKGHKDGDQWIVPGELSKNGKAHWVHLSPLALEQLPLPVCTPTNIQAWLRLWCNRHKVDPRFTPHDARRSASTRMNDNGVQPFIVERVLNHTMQGVMGVYNRAEYEQERIDAAMVLESHIKTVVEGKNNA